MTGYTLARDLINKGLYDRAQGEIAGGRRPSGAAAAALILAAMVNTKQSGIGLVAASVGAALLTSWLETGQWPRVMLRFVGLAMLPALGLYALWRYHVSVAGVPLRCVGAALTPGSDAAIAIRQHEVQLTAASPAGTSAFLLSCWAVCFGIL